MVKKVPDVHLILIGKKVDKNYFHQIEQFILKNHLEKNISYLGEKDNVMGILRKCDIGILSSVSEGFLLSLLEYGAAGLATVVTDVG